LLPIIGLAQSAFDKYEDMEQVSSVIVNKGLINLMSSLNSDGMDEEAREFMEVARGIDGIKVFITEDEGVSQDMAATVRKHLRKSSMEELMRVKDKDGQVKFYIKNGKNDNHVQELLMFVSGMDESKMNIKGRKFESVLVSLTGDIDLNKIGALTKKMNLPKELENAGGR
ncbi:MAG: DUF4252 domain-containing protein, partial [Bacteroidota bacterium]